MGRIFLIFILISVITAIFFISFPEVDLYISGLFYNGKDGFYLARNPILNFIHDSVRIIVFIIILYCFAAILLNLFNKSKILKLTSKQAVYLLLVLAIGPGLIVNTVFKDQWGRARPHQIVEFGSDKQFTPPFILTDQCERNCSFVSGDASVGFFFFALTLLFSNRKSFWVVAILASAIIAPSRILMGAHFLSDTIFSGVFTYITAYLIYIFMFRQKYKKTSE